MIALNTISAKSQTYPRFFVHLISRSVTRYLKAFRKNYLMHKSLSPRCTLLSKLHINFLHFLGLFVYSDMEVQKIEKEINGRDL